MAMFVVCTLESYKCQIRCVTSVQSTIIVVTIMTAKERHSLKDKYNLVFIICCWLGIGMFLPWNFFYNVDGYWKLKFRNVLNETVQSNKQKFWASDLSIVSMAPNFIFLLINAIFGHKMK